MERVRLSPGSKDNLRIYSLTFINADFATREMEYIPNSYRVTISDRIIKIYRISISQGKELKNMKDDLKVRTSNAIDNARVAAHAGYDDAKVAGHNSIKDAKILAHAKIDAGIKAKNTSDKAKIAAHKEFSNAKIAMHEAEAASKTI